jgi:hypothetical protein
MPTRIPTTAVMTAIVNKGICVVGDGAGVDGLGLGDGRAQ